MHRKTLITIALAGSAAYLIAQAVGPGSPSSQGTSARSIAAPSNPLNPAQELLFGLIVGDTNKLVAKAEAENRPQVVRRLIEAQCFNALTLMSPKQRDHEIHVVWQVEKWKPNGEWNHVIAAPQKAHALLTLSPESAKKIEAIRRDLMDLDIEPYLAVTERLRKEGLEGEAYRVAYERERVRINAEREKNLGNFESRVLRAKAEVRPLLSPAQQKEWDSILAGYLADLEKAYQGR